MAVDFEKECFFIAPIGGKDTDIRRRSNGVRDFVVKPAAETHGLETVRADDVGEPGQITAQAVQHCLKAKAAVADLTGGNPNVYYELSVRHGAQLPVVLIAEEDTDLPFDISQSRVIFFKHTDLTSAGKARDELAEQIEASLSAPPDNPISDGMRLAKLEGGNVEEQTLAALMDRVQRLGGVVEKIDQRLQRAEGTVSLEESISPLITRGDLRTALHADELSKADLNKLLLFRAAIESLRKSVDQAQEENDSDRDHPGQEHSGS